MQTWPRTLDKISRLTKLCGTEFFDKLSAGPKRFIVNINGIKRKISIKIQ